MSPYGPARGWSLKSSVSKEMATAKMQRRISAPTEESFIKFKSEGGIQANERTRLTQMAEGFALTQVEYLQNMLHKAHNKRELQWSGYEHRIWTYKTGDTKIIEVLNEHLAAELDAQLVVEISIAEQAQSDMRRQVHGYLDNIGAVTESEIEASFPPLWEELIANIRADWEVNPPEKLTEPRWAVQELPEDEKFEEEDNLEFIQVLPDRPFVSLDAPRPALSVPVEESLGAILARIASKDENEE